MLTLCVNGPLGIHLLLINYRDKLYCFSCYFRINSTSYTLDFEPTEQISVASLVCLLGLFLVFHIVGILNIGDNTVWTRVWKGPCSEVATGLFCFNRRVNNNC